MSDGFAEGTELGPLEVVPGLEQVVRYCGLAWAFPRFFFDAEAARAQGMPGTIVPGPLKLALLYRAVETWFGDAGYIRSVRAAHRRPDLTGAPLAILGTVARRYEERGLPIADLELVILNGDGDPSVRGFAVVELRGP
jgi:acyl dehydratase